MGLFGPSKKEREEAERKKAEEERIRQDQIAAEAVEAFKTTLKKRGKGTLPGGKEFRVWIEEPRRPCMCLPDPSSRQVARMNYEDLNCDHHATQTDPPKTPQAPKDVQELEAPVVVYDRERDGGKDKGRPMTDGPTQPRPRTLEREEEEGDDGASDDVYIPPKPRPPQPRERPTTRFNGKALDPKTGKVYYFNTKTGERKWADASEQPRSRQARKDTTPKNYGSTNINF